MFPTRFGSRPTTTTIRSDVRSSSCIFYRETGAKTKAFYLPSRSSHSRAKLHGDPGANVRRVLRQRGKVPSCGQEQQSSRHEVVPVRFAAGKVGPASGTPRATASAFFAGLRRSETSRRAAARRCHDARGRPRAVMTASGFRSYGIVVAGHPVVQKDERCLTSCFCLLEKATI